MTLAPSRSLLLLPEGFGYAETEKLQQFSLPHPSNIVEKDRVLLIAKFDKQVFQVKEHSFSKGRGLQNREDLANDNYHFTEDGQTIKSGLYINNSNREDGYVCEDGKFQYLVKWNLAYSIIGFHHNACQSQDEQEYVKSRLNTDENSDTASKKFGERFLTLRDYHDLLVDTHDENWAHVSIGQLQNALDLVAEKVNEAGDDYYKVTDDKIMQFLALKVQEITNRFPESVPLPIEAPPDILLCAKTCMAVNLLISMVPLSIYKKLTQYTADSIDIAQSFENYLKYLKDNRVSVKERELLTQAAMNVGRSNTTPVKNKLVKKPAAPKVPKVAKGKGAIDGFFKKSK